MLMALIQRNTKLLFRDKGMFFAILMTPLILLLLFVTFLGDIYRDIFTSAIPEGIVVSDRVIDGCVGSYLLSSLLAVCCVTVSFMANMMIVHDKVTGARKDIDMTPVKPSVMAMGYYLSSVITALIICLITLGIGFMYLGIVGWYLTVADILLMLLDIVLLVLFGTALSSVLYHFLSTQGQITAVSAIVSAAYGFLCGAYMPISSFSTGLQKLLSLLPGTYGTVLLRSHTMGGALEALEHAQVPAQAVDSLRTSMDCDITFFSAPVSTATMYMVLIAAVAVLTGAHALICTYIQKVKRKH